MSANRGVLRQAWIRASNRRYGRTISPHARIHRSARIDRDVLIGGGAEIRSWATVNRGSLIFAGTVDRFASIGFGVHVAPPSHSLGRPLLSTVDIALADHVPVPMRRRLLEAGQYDDSGKHLADQAGAVHIGIDAWVGSLAVILQDVVVGRGAVIGAGAVVTRNVPDFAVAVGSPARVIRYRLDEHSREHGLAVELYDAISRGEFDEEERL